MNGISLSQHKLRLIMQSISNQTSEPDWKWEFFSARLVLKNNTFLLSIVLSITFLIAAQHILLRDTIFDIICYK